MDPGKSMAVLACVIVAALVLRSIWLRRDEMLYNMRVLLISALLGFVAFSICRSAPELQDAAPFAAIGAVLFVFMLRPKRKRRMKAAARRRAIAKWELKTGKKFNTRFHEVDHEVPFSSGGNETTDNLRVVERRKNRSKGNRSPWWDLLGRR